MQNRICFSLFGNYEKFSTENIENYMKLIPFFANRGFKPSTGNELQVLPNGQVKMIIMPTFINELGVSVEIMTERLNIQKVINSDVDCNKLSSYFFSEISDILFEFVKEFNVAANRIAINCNIFKNEELVNPICVSDYFDDKIITENTNRNVARQIVDEEDVNVIIEKYADNRKKVMKYTYDINTVPENTKVRFEYSNIRGYFEKFIEIMLDLEKGMK